MKNILFLFTFLSLFHLSALAQCNGDNELVGPYNSNNGQRGVMFDITAVNDLTVTCFDAELYAGTTANYEIYYKAGSYQGSANNAAAWTFIGSASGVTSAGNHTPTPIPIYFNLAIAAGETYAFYITNDFGGGVSYTDVFGPNTLISSNIDMEVRGGVGKSYPFGLTFSYRAANVTPHYMGGLLPVELTYFEGKALDASNLLTWETASEENNEGFRVERSVDGDSWEKIGFVEGNGTSTAINTYDFEDRNPLAGNNYYRLKQMDYDGQYEYSEVVVVKREGSEFPVSLVQNPVSKQMLFHMGKEEEAYVILMDYTGKTIRETTFYQTGISEMDVYDLPTGIYFVQVIVGNEFETFQVLKQ